MRGGNTSMEYKKIIRILLVLFILLTLLANTTKVYAENIQLINYAPETNVKSQFAYGSIYWKTSSIREWLNSNQASVRYTNDPPSYASERGFLNEFTTEEYSAIAITERRVNVSDHLSFNARDGGIGDVPYYNGIPETSLFNHIILNINKDWRDYYYHDIKDKAFILSSHEMQEYILKRGNSLKKELTKPELSKLNRSNPYYEYMTSSYAVVNDTYSLMWYIDEVGNISIRSVDQEVGVAPAIHVKPTYTFNDGRLASEVKIGDTVTFGQYNGQSIKWEVINLSNGYPLLWSKNILTIKDYDEKGEIVLRDSESINFETADVFINTDLKYTNKNEHVDVTEPIIRVANETELMTRTNNAFNLTIVATDEEGGSGIDYIILPNGARDYRNIVEYNVSENGRYQFTAVDKAGNHYSFLVPVGNISPPPSVLITSSSEGWTNADVTVNIKTSFEEVTDYHVPSEITSGWFQIGFPSDYSSYADKQYRISGKVGLVSDGGGTYPSRAVARFYNFYESFLKTDEIYYTGTQYIHERGYSISDMQKAPGGYISFDYIDTIGGDFFGNLNFATTLDTHHEDDGKYTIEWKDIKIELLNKEELYIDTITLPNGTDIHQNNYSDVLTEPGLYTYKVLDSRGKITEKTIEVKIDKTNPNVTSIRSPEEFTNGEVVLQVKATDLESGVNRILKPNGEWVYMDEVEYIVNKNGVYTFEVEDNAGNVITYPVNVSTIDNENPSITILEEERGWSSSDIIVPIEINDTGVSGFKEYRFAWTKSLEKPTLGWSSWIRKNDSFVRGDDTGVLYLHIEAKDKAGNVGYINSGVYKKLKKQSSLDVGINVYPPPSGHWINQFTNLYIEEKMDEESLSLGVEKEYEITNSYGFPINITKTLPSNNEILLSQAGVNYLHIQYTFEDGSRIKQTVGPYLIDTGEIGTFVAKLIDINGNRVTGWTNKNIYLSISDPNLPTTSGLEKQYRIENYDTGWQTYTDGMKVSLEGEHRIFVRIINRAGTVSEQKMVVSKIDQTAPEVKKLNLDIKNDNKYNVTIIAKDVLAGIDYVELNNGDRSTSSDSTYVFNQLSSKPTHIVLRDKTGNETQPILFAPEPIVTYESPYTVDTSVYRGKVKAFISGDLGLKVRIHNKTHHCKDAICSFEIERNTTFAVTNNQSFKETSRIVSITNMNNSKLSLLLQGERKVSDDAKLVLKWNYNLSDGEFTCYEGGVLKTFNALGTDMEITAINTMYDCLLKGDYGGEALVSNRIFVHPNKSKEVIDFDLNRKSLNHNVYVNESLIGTSYFINTKQSNSKDNIVPLPGEIFN